MPFGSRQKPRHTDVLYDKSTIGETYERAEAIENTKAKIESRKYRAAVNAAVREYKDKVADKYDVTRRRYKIDYSGVMVGLPNLALLAQKPWGNNVLEEKRTERALALINSLRPRYSETQIANNRSRYMYLEDYSYTRISKQQPIVALQEYIPQINYTKIRRSKPAQVTSETYTTDPVKKRFGSQGSKSPDELVGEYLDEIEGGSGNQANSESDNKAEAEAVDELEEASESEDEDVDRSEGHDIPISSLGRDIGAHRFSLADETFNGSSSPVSVEYEKSCKSTTKRKSHENGSFSSDLESTIESKHTPATKRTKFVTPLKTARRIPLESSDEDED